MRHTQPVRAGCESLVSADLAKNGDEGFCRSWRSSAGGSTSLPDLRLHRMIGHCSLQGKSGVTSIDRFNTEDFSTKFAGEIKELGIDGFIDAQPS